MNLPRDREGAASAREWLKHAQSDLRLARLAMNTEVLSEQVCFHAQQAAEKALKALLLSQCVDFPFTHDLAQLLEVLQSAGIAAPAEVRDADSLTPHAVQARYPAPETDLLSRAELTALRQMTQHRCPKPAKEIMQIVTLAGSRC